MKSKWDLQVDTAPSAPVRKIKIPPRPKSAMQLQLHFHPVRGRLDKDATYARWQDPKESARVDGVALKKLVPAEGTSKSPDNVLQVDVQALPEVDGVVLAYDAARDADAVPVVAQGEAPELFKLIYVNAAGDPVIVYTVEGDHCPESAQYYRAIIPLRTPMATPNAKRDPVVRNVGVEEYMAELDALLSAAPSKAQTTPYRKYFRDLDASSSPPIIKYLTRDPHDPMLAAVGGLMTGLKNRLRHRLRAGAGKSPCPSLRLDEQDEQWGEMVSNTMLGLAREHFRSQQHQAFDLAMFEDAFEMFANGELRLRLPSLPWTTQPSSGAFFLFAEFALLAISIPCLSKTDRDLWKSMLPTLVRCQRIFVRVYPTAEPSKAVFDSYSACHYSPLGVFSSLEKRALRECFASMTVEQLCSQATAHHREYLGGEA